MKGKIRLLFYGDSNTYGFDPRNYICGRYPLENIWTSLVAEALGKGYEVINKGMNGRRLPVHEETYFYVKDMMRSLSRDDLFCVMLGSNDLLCTLKPDADEAVHNADRFLQYIVSDKDHPKVLLLAPPYIRIKDEPEALSERYFDESVRMNEGFRLIAEKYGIYFADTGSWSLDFAYDGVHLSEEGHRVFAVRLLPVLKSIISGS